MLLLYEIKDPVYIYVHNKKEYIICLTLKVQTPLSDNFVLKSRNLLNNFNYNLIILGIISIPFES